MVNQKFYVPTTIILSFQFFFLPVITNAKMIYIKQKFNKNQKLFCCQVFLLNLSQGVSTQNAPPHIVASLRLSHCR